MAIAPDAPSPVGSCALDEGWRFVSIDETAQRYLGTTAEAALGRTLWELAPGLVGTACEREYRRAMATGEPRGFVGPSVVRPGRWLEVRLARTGGGLAVQLEDVTARLERPLTAAAAGRA